MAQESGSGKIKNNRNNAPQQVQRSDGKLTTVWRKIVRSPKRREDMKNIWGATQTLAADLPNDPLEGVNFNEESTLTTHTPSGSELESRQREAKVLQEPSQLTNANFKPASFENVDFSASKLESSQIETDFSKAKGLRSSGRPQLKNSPLKANTNQPQDSRRSSTWIKTFFNR